MLHVPRWSTNQTVCFNTSGAPWVNQWGVCCLCAQLKQETNLFWMLYQSNNMLLFLFILNSHHSTALHFLFCFLFLLSRAYKCLDLCLQEMVKCKMTGYYSAGKGITSTNTLKYFCLLHMFSINHLIAGNNILTARLTPMIANNYFHTHWCHLQRQALWMLCFFFSTDLTRNAGLFLQLKN